jgi:hypothetical protein
MIPPVFVELAATINPEEERATPHRPGGFSLGRSGRITGSCVTFAVTTEFSSSHKYLAALPCAGEC